VTPPDLHALAERFDRRCVHLTERGRTVSLATHRLLARGEPVSDEAIAAATGLAGAEVRRVMDGWPSVQRDVRGRITGFWGLSLDETAHRFVVEGRTLHTWCAWDALFLPRILGRGADVSSRSGASGVEVRLRVTPSDVVSLTGPDVVVSFVDPDRCDFAADRVISTFCCHVFFFATREEGEAWVRERDDGTFLLTLEEAFDLGHRTNALMYGDALMD